MKKSLLILSLLCSVAASGQKTNSGTDFWMAFMKNYTGSGNSLRLYISSTFTTKVWVDIPGQNYKDSGVVQKDSVIIITIPTSVGYISLFDTVLNNGIHITSKQPVSVSAMNLITATTDASIVLPTANLPPGATYITGHPNGAYKPANEFMLVACEDSTLVDITPVSKTFTGKPANTTFRIRLNKGQIYQVGSDDKNPGMSGSVVQVINSKKLALFSGDYCSNWPCGACDHQYEQVLPNAVLDTAVCAPPHFGHTNGYYLKIIPIDTVANFTINGYTYNNVRRNNPLTFNVTSDSGYYVKSDKLFHCYQFMKGTGCNGYITGSYGDPAMLSLVSTKHFGNKAIFSTVNSSNLRDHFVSIVTSTAGKNKVYFDKTKVDSSEFKPFSYAKSYSYACLKITDGVHILESTDGLLAYCYGIGGAESYLYLAGFNLPNFDLSFKDSILNYNCKDNKFLVRFKAKSEKTLKSYKWFFGDGQTAFGDPVNHTYNAPGTYTVKLLGEDFNGKKDSVTQTIRIDYPEFDPIRNKIICGLDTVQFEINNPFFANIKWQDSSSNSYLKVWSSKNVWVRATDTSGYCKFTDSGVVGKIDVFSSIVVDTIDNCFRSNRFRFRDSTSITSDQIDHKAWVFPWTTIWDKSDTTVRFPMPGRYKVYFDVYTKQVNCKARYPIDIIVHPNSRVYPKLKGEEFCSKKPFFLYDSSEVVTGRIARVQWDFDDKSTTTSDSLKTYKSLTYNKFNGEVIRFYKHIAITDHGCRDTALNAAKVWPKPDVGFSISTPDTIKCLPSARWTFTSTTKVDVDSFDLFWDAGNGQKSKAFDMRNVRYTSPGIYKVKLLAKSPFGCDDSASRTLEVIPVPKAGFSIPDTAQCLKGNLFSLSDSSKGAYLSAFWTIDNSIFKTGKNVDSLRFPTSGIKSVKLLVKSPYAGCTDSVTRWLNVLAPPVAIFSSSPDSACLGSNNFNLSNQSLFTQTYLNNLWKADGNVVGNSYNLSTLSFTDSGMHRITLEVTDAENCSDTVSAFVFVLPDPDAGFSINDSIQCATSNRFVFRTRNSFSEQNIWKINNQIVQSSTLDSAVSSGLSAGNYRVVLIQETPAGCMDSAVSLITVPVPPKADFTINKDTQCLSSNNFSLGNSSLAGPDPIVYYRYRTPSGLYLQADISSISFADTGCKTVTLTVLTAEGCSDSVSKILTVMPEPRLLITGDTVCIGEPASIRGTQTEGSPVNSWNWELGDGNTGSGQNLSHNYSSEGVYTLKLSAADAFNCTATETALNAVLVNPLPNPTFTVLSSEFGINEMRLRFTPVLSSGNSYRWMFPDGSSLSTDTPVIITGEPFKGNVRLKVTDSNGCEDESIQYFSFFPNNFNMYVPNAISLNQDLLNDEFRVEGLGEVPEFEMIIYSQWGEEIFISRDVKTGWNGTYMDKIVPQGVYAYLIRFSYFNGKTYTYRGTVTVLR